MTRSSSDRCHLPPVLSIQLSKKPKACRTAGQVIQRLETVNVDEINRQVCWTRTRQMGNWHLVRHGETEWNRDGRIQGHTDVPLNELGRRQIKTLAKRLAERKFSMVYASDLSRAIETAQTIAGVSDASIKTYADLREFSYGDWEGLTLKEAEAKDSGLFAELMKLENSQFSAPNGETTPQVLDRVRRFYTSEVQCLDPADDILVVAHGGSIRALLVCLLGLPDELFWQFRVDCASLSIISDHPDNRVLDLWNDTSHLVSIV